MSVVDSGSGDVVLAALVAVVKRLDTQALVALILAGKHTYNYIHPHTHAPTPTPTHPPIHTPTHPHTYTHPLTQTHIHPTQITNT